MSTLAEITANVAADLKDAANVTWSPDELTRAVRWALQELSWATPRRAAAIITAVEDQREYSLAAAGLDEALFITEVWHPYDAASPAYPPVSAPWRLLDDDTFFLDADSVAAGEGMRVFYARAHTIAGLDAAVATTLNADHEELICLGAAGYAALQRAQDSIGQVNMISQAPLLWRQWGERRLAEFRARLTRLARRTAEWRTAWTGPWTFSDS